jgi:hypothetical protein
MRNNTRIRVFGFRYHKASAAMVRENDCHCDQEENGTVHEGDIWHYESGDDVWVKVAVAFFPNPTTEGASEEVEETFGKSVQAADQWIQNHYHWLPLQ